MSQHSFGNGSSSVRKQRSGFNTFHWRHHRKRALMTTAVVTLLFLGLIANYGFKIDCFKSTTPRHNIVFLKTHKCASSTIQNILLRYGDTHNLTIALPSSLNYFGHPAPFHRKFVPNAANHSFNILAHHTRFNYAEMKLLIPAEDTVFISIVREPSELLESLYSYFLLSDIYDKSLETFLKNETTIVQVLAYKRYYSRMGLNQMAFDMGLPPSDFLKPDVVHKFCNLLNSQFDLVMVAERMDESLILLMDLLRWTMDDIVVFRHNVRKTKFKTKLSSTALESLKRVSLADEIIYAFFVERFDHRVRAFGTTKMATMVAALREKTERVYRTCVSEAVDNTTPRPPNNNSSQNKMNNNINRKDTFEERYMLQYKPKMESDAWCDKLLKTELSYTEYLREKQNEKFRVKTLLATKKRKINV